MAAYAALVSLMNILEQIKNHPHFSTSFDTNQIESLGKNIDFFLGFVENCNSNGGVGKEEEQDLESQIASAAHEAEDVIESHIVNQILPGSAEIILDVRLHHVNFLLDFVERNDSDGTKKSKEDVGELQTKMNSSQFTRLRRRCLFGLQKVLLDMESIKNEVLKIKEQRDFNSHKPTNSTPAASSTALIITEKSSTMVGFEDELYQLKDVLTGQESSRQIISIAGMGGMGKTTLARNVYDDSLTLHHFDLRAWATISQDYNVREIILQLLSFQGKFTNETVDELGLLLHKSLVGRRYLIVLDDMWISDVWDSIKFYFPDNGTGSRIVVTTRLLNVATYMNSFCIRINFLDEHKSWNLFCQNVFGEEDCPPLLVEIGMNIVKQCKGLPLSIVVIGGLLRKSSRSEECWQSIARDINSILSSRDQCLDVLYLSYSYLPAHLKPCFLYMGTYEEDYKIHVSEITELWVAEGFLKPNGAQLLEETAEDYLKELIDRNLILISEHRSNGKIKSCRIHDLLRELCLRVGEKEKFFSELRVQSVPQDMDRERRLIFHDTTSSSRNSEVFRAFQSASLARSLLCDVSQVPAECRLLRVLKRAFHWSTEAEHQLVNLRYISYYANWDGSMFPSSMHLIWCLQTLIIKRRNMRTVSPLEIWKMAQLRHVKGSQIYVPDPPLSGEDDDSVVLRNLQTLIKVVNFRFSEEACKRIPNIKKLHLMYGDIWKGYDDGLYETIRNLSRLHKLESLNIGCSETTRIYISELENTFPSSLNELSLEDCHFHWGDLSTIVGSLPQLEVLELRGPFIDEHKWSCIEGSFVRLKVLEIRNGNLYYWSLESASCFPVLEKLVLVEFSGLMEIPSSVGEISTLQLIRLEHCSECLAISALKIKEEQESYGNDGLLVQVRMSGEVADSLRERVKKEGLSISNFQLLDNWKAKFAVS